jgi:hypothetical protein
VSATTATAIKALLEAAGLGITFYRDEAPPAASMPYGVVSEAITVNSEPAFSAFDDPEGHVAEQVQIDVWQQRRNPTTNAITESYTLPDATYLALHGECLTTLPTYGGHMRVLGRTRLLEDEGQTIHDAITVEVRRTLLRVGAVRDGGYGGY